MKSVSQSKWSKFRLISIANPFNVLLMSIVILLGGCSTAQVQEKPVQPEQDQVADVQQDKSHGESTSPTSEEPAPAESKQKSAEAVKEKVVEATPKSKKKAKTAVKKKSVSKAAKPKKKVVTKKAPKPKSTDAGREKVGHEKANLKIIDKTKPIEVVPSAEAVPEEGSERKALIADLSQLPIEIDSHWTLSRDMGESLSCTLSYKQISMFDGQGDTRVDLLITPSQMIFKTRSNIDLSYENTGLKVGDMPLVSIEGLHNDMSVKFEQAYSHLVDAFKQHELAQLYLGFWPTWPVTQAYKAEFELGGFSDAFAALNDCIQLENDLR